MYQGVLIPLLCGAHTQAHEQGWMELSMLRGHSSSSWTNADVAPPGAVLGKGTSAQTK